MSGARGAGVSDGGGDNLGCPLLQLKHDPRTAGIPTILGTVHLDFLRDHQPELELYGAQVVANPFDVDDLLGIVQSTLERRGHAAS